jgi:cardiolipin synthase A/B
MSISDISWIIGTVVALYGLLVGAFLISENRSPQATLAWMLAFIRAPGLGVLIYFLFGRDTKAFSGQRTLLQQDLAANALPVLTPILSSQDTAIEQLGSESVNRRRLLRLVRHNSLSALTQHNHVEIQQDAATFYPSLMDDMRGARYSIHLQYFIWRADPFTEQLKQILTEKARSGVEVRLLYDPVGSHAHLTRAYLRDLRAAGVRVAPTSPLYRAHTISYRNHRKITVVDGTIGYTGGMNIGQEQLDGGEGFDAWRDTQVRIVGEADIVASGVRVFRYEKGYLHAKTISVDSKVCSIGSANIDIRSFSINYEINAVLYSEPLAKELEGDFERDLAGCSEFEVSAYEARHSASRFRDSVARLLSPLL